MEASVDGCQNDVGPMRIVLLADSFLPHSGGSRVYYYHLYKNLVTDFPDQVTVLTKKVPDWEEFDRQESTECLRIIRRFKPLSSWKYHELPKIVFPFAEAVALARRQNIDLIHCGDLYPQGVIGLALKYWLGIPYLVFCHGEEITQTDCRRYQPYVRDCVYKRADGVVAANEFAVSNLTRIGIAKDRIRKITPGVDYRNFQPRPPRVDLVQRFSLKDKVVLLTVARLVPRKGHDVVLAALAKILPEIPDVRYLIVGKGPGRDRLELLATELGIGHVVKFVGCVPDHALADFYNLCDLFVMPNRTEPDGDVEGFGMAFLEAGALCKPVVGGRSGGAVHAILHGVTGFLVDPQSVGDVAAALKKLLVDPALRRQMGLAGEQRVRAEFCWQRSARDLRQLSSDILQRARAASRAIQPTLTPQPSARIEPTSCLNK